MTTLRVLTYNIHCANPPARPGSVELDAIAAVISSQHPDVVLLQEVDVHTHRSGRHLDQAAELGRLTSLEPCFFRALDYDGGEYGLALLSRYPLTDLRRFDLPGEGEPRIAALANLSLPDGRPIVVACTHLDVENEATRRLQARSIVAHLAMEPLPVVLGGDFNDTPDSETVRILGELFDGLDGEPTFPADAPKAAIDFIGVKGPVRIRGLRAVPETQASDHRPVLAVIEFP